MNDINKKGMKMVEPRIVTTADRDHRRLETLARDLDAPQPRTAPVRRLEPDHDMERELGEVVDKSITDLARLSSEAVMHQWETTAQSVEALGVDVKAMIGKLRDEMARCDDNLKRLAETAAEIREQGKLAQSLVERSSMLSEDLRATCEGLSKKLKA